MTKELQNLLERIQKDGVDKAEREAAEITSKAEARAKETVAEAERKAKEIIEKAENDSKVFVERGKTALQQAARDVLLSLREAIQQAFKSIVAKDVTASLDKQALTDMLTRVVKSYCEAGAGSSALEVSLSENDEKALADSFIAKFKEELKQGIEIKGDNAMSAGFRVTILDEHIEYDFSDEAMTEALCQSLRPHIADIVRASTSSSDSTE